MFLKDRSLEELLSESFLSSPAVSIDSKDTLAEAAILLPHHLETFTDSLVVTKDDVPVGIVGGFEVLDGILKNQTKGYLDKAKVSDVMNKNLVIISAKDKLSDLTDRWSKTRRAFAITQNKYHGYSAISARKILEIGTRYNIDNTISSIPRKEIVKFGKNDTIKNVIEKMFWNHTRKLVLDGSGQFINDRIIIEKMVREFDCMRDGRDFLGTSASMFSLDKAEMIQEDITISQACKKMQEMKSPYLIANNGTISPWDMVLILGSKNLSMK